MICDGVGWNIKLIQDFINVTRNVDNLQNVLFVTEEPKGSFKINDQRRVE